MSVTKNAVDFIKDKEGCVLRVYLDSANVPTIGYGSTMYDTGKRVQVGDPPITKERAEELLAWEIRNKSRVLDGLLKGTKLTDNQYSALLSFVYNVGVGALEHSTLLRRVRINPNDPFIADAFLMWVKITVGGKKVVSKGLVSRRKKEIALYFSK